MLSMSCWLLSKSINVRTNMPNNVLKSVATEAMGTTAEHAFADIAMAAGFPALALAAPLAKGLVLGIL